MTDPAPDAERERADALLALRCRLGEADAFDALVARWHPPLAAYLRRQAGRDELARDLVQETWLRILRGIARLRDGTRLRAWLFGIARRVWLDHLRASYAQAPAADADLDALEAADAPADLGCDLARLRVEIERLPPLEREALALFHLDELSLAEAAQVLDVPVGTVKSRLFRARTLLRRHLDTPGTSP